MPRRKRQQSPTNIYHWINRGISRKDLFHTDEDYEHFKYLVIEHKDEHEIQVYHYCLMTNHIHMLLFAPDLARLANFSQITQRRYAYYYQDKYGWKGQLFQRMYRGIPISNEIYLLECGRYIERNPVRAGMVNHPDQYRYSSHHFYAGATKDQMVALSPAYLALTDRSDMRQRVYAEYVSQPRPHEALLDQILKIT